MCIPGVVPEACRSKNILDVERCLGVEAARPVVMDELLTVMEGHGVEVNIRHVMLLADLMTNRVSARVQYLVVKPQKIQSILLRRLLGDGLRFVERFAISSFRVKFTATNGAAWPKQRTVSSAWLQ